MRREPRAGAAGSAGGAASGRPSMLGRLRLANRQLTDSLRLLERSRDSFAELYDSAPFAYLTLDRVGLIREINTAGADLLGATDRSQVVGRRLLSYVVEDDRGILVTHLQGCRQQPGPRTCELRLATGGEAPIP